MRSDTKIDKLFEEAEKLRFENTAYITVDELKESIKKLFYKEQLKMQSLVHSMRNMVDICDELAYGIGNTQRDKCIRDMKKKIEGYDHDHR